MARLLDKNPATRIGWDGLPGHPFWQAAPLPLRDMPEQPLFERFIKEQGLCADPLPPTLHPEVWREIMQACKCMSILCQKHSVFSPLMALYAMV